MNRRERRRQERLGGEAAVTDDKAVNTAKARVRAAENRLQEGDRSGALDALREAQTLDPENTRAWYLQAMIDFNAGRLDDAADAIVKAATNEQSDAAVHANCAAIMNVCDRPMEAEASARYALELDPDMAEAYCNLGVALEAQGKIADARENLTIAISKKPGYMEAILSLGNLSFRTGDYMTAVESFADAVRAAPENAMARTNLAIALRHLGELATAEQQCLEAIAIDPGYAEAHNALGNILLQLGDLPGAIKAFEDAMARREGYAEAMANLAGAKFKSGDYAEAESAYIDVIESHPQFAEAVHGLGVVLLAQGKRDDAVARFRRAVEIRPGFGEAWMNIVDADANAISDDDLQELRKRADDSRLADADRTAFAFALGAAEDARKDYAAAAAAYLDGNKRRVQAATRADTLFDADAFDAEVASVIAAFDTERLSALKEYGDAAAQIVFVCGMPRSGSTLVEQALAAHPEIHGVGEADILSGLLDDYPNAVESLTAEEIRGLADSYVRRLSRRPSDNGWVVDKTPQNVFFLGLAQILFPSAKVIHCARDPRDVAISCFMQNFKASGLEWSSDLESIRRYAEAEQRMMQHWRETLSLPILDLTYEAFVDAPEDATRQLADFLDLEWDSAMSEPHLSSGAVLTASNWQVRKPVYRTSIGRWEAYADILNMAEAN